MLDEASTVAGAGTVGVDESPAPRFCQWCSKPIESNARFCGECGGALTEAPGAAEAPTRQFVAPEQGSAWQRQVQSGGWPTQPPSGVVSQQVPYAIPYPVAGAPPPGASGPHTGLIVGLVGASLAAIAAIAAAILLASGGGGSGPTISTAGNAAAAATPSAGAASPSSAAVTPPVSSGKGSGSGVTPHQTTHVAPPGPSTSSGAPSAVPSAGAASASGDPAGVVAAVSRHWALINSGDFEGAFALLAPGFQDHGSWIASHQKESPISASISLGTPSVSSATSATISVVNLHTTASDGCFNFTGSYGMTKAGGQWLISSANLTEHGC